MKTKYYYNKENGLIYRVSGQNVDFMYSRCGEWTVSDMHSDEMHKSNFSPISSSVVKHFESQGGYVPHFRSL